MSQIILKINGKQYVVDGKYGPDFSLNEFIRNVADLRGTKAMCHEGGCGACVVAVRAPQPQTNEIKTFAVNSCLVSVLSCHGWEVITTEGIGNRTMGYHDIQTRLASFNGTQCGFCTPGWVMNMYSLHENKKGQLTEADIENSFASNMCRCTGYRPIADAFKSFATDANEKLLSKVCDLEDLATFKACGVNCAKKENCCHKNSKATVNGKRNDGDDWCHLGIVVNDTIVVDCGTHKWYKVFNLDEAFKSMEVGDYKLVAGNTGQGVFHVTEYPPNVIDIFNVEEIKGYVMDVNLVLGAGMPLTDMMELFLRQSQADENFFYLKQFHDHMDLVAHIPVRNIGTIGGNLFLKHSNIAFQSDLFLLFETVGATMTIAESNNRRMEVSLPQFLSMDMRNKLILNIKLPPLPNTYLIKTYKIMPRSQNAHAVINAGFLFKLYHNTNRVERATIVYGGISPSFIHASRTENVLREKDLFTNETLQMALRSLFDEIYPEDAPPEPSSAYRKMLAISLFYKAMLALCPDNGIDPKYRSGGEAIKRIKSKGTQTFDSDESVWPVNKAIPKLEALVQCSGEAVFANDLPKQIDEVFAAFVTADVRPGSVIKSFDASEALKIPGVIAFYTAKDIPGKNVSIPTVFYFYFETEEILCESKVKFYGQPAGIIVADREKTAARAAKLVKITYETVNANAPLLSIKDVLNSPEKDQRVKMVTTLEPTETGNDVQHEVRGDLDMESQYHYYMELQTCIVKPTEDGIEVYSATQWLDLINITVADALNIPLNRVNVIVRRVGGGYGGKISRGSQIACAAALVSHLQGKTCRFILPLQTNMKTIGKRMPTYGNYEVGVNNQGEIQYLKNTFYQDGGYNSNEVLPSITAEHFKNCYDSKRWYIQANNITTDTPSHTWCRSPFTTEGVAMVENIMENIAFKTGKDATQVRLANMEKNIPLPALIDQLKIDAEYDQRVEQIKNFNNENRWRKRAIKLVPLKYTVFYFGNYNSIVSIYHGDGSVVIIHGGIEMGQGLNTKVAQVCAYKLGIPLERISVKPSTSFTSPNSNITGGSVGSECVAFATLKACDILNQRLEPHKGPDKSWEKVISDAYAAGIDLQASYMFSTNDNLKSYDIYAACVLEVEVDILTGNHDVKRVDILEDTGRSLNPEIDVAQIEGAFIMGLGYWTSEKLVYNLSSGELLTDRTWTYKPPGIKDIPEDMRIYLQRNSNNEFGVLQSKATGEPAFCLATVIIHALREAVRAARLDAGYADEWVPIEVPCTVENIFTAVGHKIEHFKLK